MAIEKELLDQLLAGRDPNEVFARDGLLDDLKKALSERILNAELDEHLEDESTKGNANRRNGHSRESVLTGTSKMTLTIPRDRAGTVDFGSFGPVGRSATEVRFLHLATVFWLIP